MQVGRKQFEHNFERQKMKIEQRNRIYMLCKKVYVYNICFSPTFLLLTRTNVKSIQENLIHIIIYDYLDVIYLCTCGCTWMALSLHLPSFSKIHLLLETFEVARFSSRFPFHRNHRMSWPHLCASNLQTCHSMYNYQIKEQRNIASMTDGGNRNSLLTVLVCQNLSLQFRF